MIKLNRSEAPAYLSDDKIVELTNEFKINGVCVWNIHHIKEPLLASSYGKCAYCECPLTTQSNYMEVEHFEDKSNNPNKVILWENLLPSCKKCNGAKGIHDVISEPIVNPYIDEPKEHLSLRLYRLRGKTQVGERTIDVIDLNNSCRLVFPRYEIGEKISDLIEVSCERFHLYKIKKDVRSRNRLIGVVESLLNECQPVADYSACTATNLLTDEKFLELIKNMKAESIWNDELELSLRTAGSVVLDCS
ncbi:MAG: HNH endonuclease [Nitrosomonas sp.]|nr:HNH endonuclease [Nitrosomonas sp.]